MPTVSEFQVLRRMRPLVRILSVYNTENFRGNANAHVRNVLRAIGCTAAFFTEVGATSFYCLACLRPDSEWNERAFNLALMLTLAQQCFILTANVRQNREICNALDQLQRIVDKRAIRSLAIYEQVEQRWSSLFEIAAKAFAGVGVIMYAMPMLQPLSYVVFGHPEPSEWTIEHGAGLPPGAVAFFVGWLFLFAASTVYCFIILQSVMYFFGMCAYVAAIVDDLATTLDRLDEAMRNQPDDRLAHLKCQLALAEAIQLHNDVISLATIFGKTMSEVLFYQMLFSAIEIATYMFTIDEGMSTSNYIAVMGTLFVLLETFLFCRLSETMTGRLAMIGDAIYGCSWYCLSSRQQKMFLLPIQRAQQEFRLNGIGMVDCSLEIFTRIIRAATSYFLLLRSFQ